MKRFLLLLIGMLLMMQFVAAQVNLDYCSGYIVLENNDTLYGELSKIPYNTYLTKVSFRGKDTISNRVYTAYELKCFHYNPDVTMVSMEVPSISKKDTTTSIWRFALRRLSGPVELLLLYAPNGEVRYFVQNKAFGLSELRNPIQMVNNQVFRDNGYMAVLTKYTNDVPGFQDRIRNSNFKEGALVSLLSDYNGYFGRIPDLKPKLEWEKSWLINVGMMEDLFAKSDLVYSFGMEYAFSNPTNLKRSEIVVGMNYKRLNSDNSISMPIFWRYNNCLNLISPVFEFGIEPGYYQGILNSVQREFNNSDQPFFLLPIVGLGVSLNYKQFRLKYMATLNTLFLRGFTLQYQLK